VGGLGSRGCFKLGIAKFGGSPAKGNAIPKTKNLCSMSAGPVLGGRESGNRESQQNESAYATEYTLTQISKKNQRKTGS